MYERFICINGIKYHINEFKIGYIIDPGFNVKKSFIEQVQKCIYTTFGEITQTIVKSTLAKKNKILLALIIFYETRAYNPKKYFRVLSFFIYSIIKNYVCIDYLYFQSKTIK